MLTLCIKKGMLLYDIISFYLWFFFYFDIKKYVDMQKMFLEFISMRVFPATHISI